MKKHSKTKALLLFALTAVVSLIPFVNIAAVDADTPITSVSPPYAKVTLQPGESYKASFKLTNTGGGTLEYKAYATPYTVASDDESYSSPDYSNATKYSKISEWIQIDEADTSGSLEALAENEINYTIKVPKDASPGGQYAAIVIERTNADSVGATNANVASVPRVAYVIYASVAGQANNSGSISQNNISSFFLSTPISATSLVENTGNVHSDAEYILQVYPLFSNEEVYTNEENPETYIILPETRRFITQTWSDGAPNIGIFKVKQTVKFAGTESVNEKLVVVCPVWLLLAIVFVIVFWIIWLVMRSKNRKANKGKSAGKSSKPSSTSSTTSSRPTPSDKSEPKSDTTE